jgi:hypothetical protein
MVATELTQVPSDEESTMVDVAKLSAPLATASEEDAASYTEIDEQRDALDTVESEEDVDASTLAALLQRYNQSMSVSMSMSGEEDAKLQNADSDVKETDDTEEDEDDDDIDEDGYAARAKDIMQRYKTEYALSEDSEQTSADSDEDGEEKEEDEEQHRDVDIDGVEKGDATFSECIEERAEELINKSRQMLDSSEMNVQEEEGKEDGDGIDAESVEEVDLLANVEIGEELGSQTFEEDAEVDTSSSESVEEEEAESEMTEEDLVEDVPAEDEDLEGVGSEPAEDEVLEDVESELLEDVEIGEEAAADIECSASNATEVTEDLEEMMAQLMKENEELKKKKELQKRIDDLAKENKKLKESTNETPQRSALASVACKFDDAVTTAVTKVSKIMVCAPADEDIFDAEGGLVTMSDESFPSSGDPQDENGVCVVGSESEDGKNVSSTWVTDGAMDENLNLQSAARRNAYNMKMQAYNEKYHPHAPEESKPPMSDHPVSLIDATLLEARIATGEATNATTADSLDEAMRRVEEAKQFIKNRSLLKTQTQANY